MKNIFAVIRLLLLALLFTNSFAQKSGNPNFDKYFENLPFKMDALKVPNFPDQNFPITDFGASGDGISVNTEAFSRAISKCASSGGGKVIVPAGIWLTGPIYLMSNVNLHLETGSHIQFTKNFEDYPLIESNYEGVNQFRCTSPISARNVTNIAITGDGIIDGAGEAWRPVKKGKLTESQWRDLVKSGGALDKKGDMWWPTKEAMEYSAFASELKKRNKKLIKEDAEKYKVFFRPVMVSINGCKNVWLDGVTFQNSPAWNIHPLLSENIIVTNLNVRNPWYSQNGDGIDLESCKNSFIYNAKFDVGDDAICMKSGKDEEGRKRNRPTENVLIKDCVVYHGHGGFTIGSETSGSIRNIKVDNCNFIGTDIGLRFKSNRSRGGVVENIWISNIYMKEIPTDALSFNMFYGGFAPDEESRASENSNESKMFPVNEATPQFKNIFMKNIFCDGAKDAIVIQGLPEMTIKGIEIENAVMKAERGISIYDADGIKFSNVKILSGSPVVKISQSRNVYLEDLRYGDRNDVVLKLEGAGTQNIFLKGNNALEIKNKTQKDAQVNTGALILK